MDLTLNHLAVFSRVAPVVQHRMSTRVPAEMVQYCAPCDQGEVHGVHDVDIRGEHVPEVPQQAPLVAASAGTTAPSATTTAATAATAVSAARLAQLL